MPTEQELWLRFKNVQNKIDSLSFIVQNPLGDYKVPAEELAEWIEKANQASSELGRLVLDTYSFLEVNNAKDI